MKGNYRKECKKVKGKKRTVKKRKKRDERTRNINVMSKERNSKRRVEYEMKINQRGYQENLDE
jgi:hypothetical protein